VRSDYIPFGRPDFSEQEIEAVARVMRSGWVGMGAETIRFERELAEYVGAAHAVSVNSCTSALFLALLVQGIGPGDEVICPSFTWCSSANAALYAGATPVFCDIDADTLAVTPETVAARLSPRTRAVVVVHFGGLAVDVAALRAMLPGRVVVVEDAAHALGARYPDGRPVGASGNLCCFSFYANKNLSTGEGGALTLDDSQLAQRLQSLRQHALPIDAWQRFTHPHKLLLSSGLAELGYKMNYTDLQSAIGRVQLRRQGEFAARRREIASRYVAGLGELEPPLRFQRRCTEPDHARHLFVIQLACERLRTGRDAFILALREKNVGATMHYLPLHAMPLYKRGAAPPRLPVTEDVARRCVTLPISASMTLEDAEYVVASAREVYG
jgi:dTDP-4-amino-4,6-dideoxygalactose transaminase